MTRTRKEVKKLFNREQHFTLAQKRLIRNLIDALFDESEILQAQIGENSVEIYGSSVLFGDVIWLSGLTFAATPHRYIINGTIYEAPATEVTLTAADATNPRIDVIYADTSGTIGYLTGTPAADPAKPEVDSNTQVELTFVTVAANATTPTAVNVNKTIYAEDAGDPGEWDTTASGARVDPDSTLAAYAGTKSIAFLQAQTGDYVDLDAGAGNELAGGDFDALELHISAPSDWGNKRLEVAFFNGANRATAWVRIENGLFGLSVPNSGFQTVVIPAETFNFTSAQVDSLRIQVAGGGGSSRVTAYIDQIRAQSGAQVTIINNFVGLTEEELINNVRTFNAQQPFGNATLTDGATISWDLDTQPIASVVLDGNRTLATPTNIRAGGTYYLRVVQDDTTGSRTLTWPAEVKWAGGTAPTLSTAVDSEDIFSFVSFDGTTLMGTSALDMQ